MASVKRIDHVAIAVRSIEESRRAFEDLYGAEYLGQKEKRACYRRSPSRGLEERQRR